MKLLLDTHAFIAQAMCEKMALLTADANMQGYDVPIIW